MRVRTSSSTTPTVPEGILDIYTGAAAAYSLRKLRKAYTNAAIRVRRSNDNAEQNIGFTIFGTLDESELSTFVGANSGFITTWYDQSGNARNAVQANAALQPRIVNSGIVERQNGIISLAFDGTGDNLVTVSNIGLSGNPQFSIFMLNNFVLPTQQVNLSFGSPATGAGFHFMGANSSDILWVGFGGGTQLAAVSNPNFSNMKIFSIHRTGANGADWTIRANRSNLSFSAPNNNTVTLVDSPMVIGAWVANSNFSQMKCSELILFPSNQVSVGSTIETNALSYYGIT